MKKLLVCFVGAHLLQAAASHAAESRTILDVREYEDRVQAAWTGQIIAAMMGWPFEHQAAAAVWVDRFPHAYSSAPVDDDWYYEMVAVRAFEKFGPGLTVEQLG